VARSGSAARGERESSSREAVPPPPARASPPPARACAAPQGRAAAAMPYSTPQPTGCRARTQRALQPARTAGAAIRADPLVLLIPLLLFVLCITGGIVATEYAAASSAEAERNKAISLLSTVVTVRFLSSVFFVVFLRRSCVRSACGAVCGRAARAGVVGLRRAPGGRPGGVAQRRRRQVEPNAVRRPAVAAPLSRCVPPPRALPPSRPRARPLPALPRAPLVHAAAPRAPPAPAQCATRPLPPLPPLSCVSLKQMRRPYVPPSPAQAFESLLHSTFAPMLVVQKHIEYGPGSAQHASVKAFWAATAMSLVGLSPAIDDVQLSPYGLAVSIVPLVTSRRNATGVIALGGHDLLNASSPVANRRAAALLAIQTRTVMIEGPKSLLLPNVLVCLGSCVIDPLLGILARQAIFVASNSSVDEWSGGTTWPGVLPGQTLGPKMEATNCSGVLNPVTGLSICATNATGDGTRFWGFATVIVIWKQLLEMSKVSDLGGANGMPYQWSVSRSNEASLGIAPFTWVYISGNTGPLPAAFSDDAVFATSSVFSSVWGFTLQKPGGWRPAWEGGVIAGVVLLSVILTVFAFLLLLERSLHLELLYSMLPRRMVKKIQSNDGGGFAESFEHVVVLFSAFFTRACAMHFSLCVCAACADAQASAPTRRRHRVVHGPGGHADAGTNNGHGAHITPHARTPCMHSQMILSPPRCLNTC
jgi:hypothetical protein